ncbi:MAG TPA: DinB family protein [Actinomycetota bacterium]|jgi:hypothetical protein|nr:DinB family protein [Actinomycetota bacterium]
MLSVPGRPTPPPKAADERTMLTTFLDYERTVFLRKVGGLEEDDLRRVMTSSGLTLLGMLKHLGFVERLWFRVTFAGEDVPLAWSEEDRDADWHPEPHERAPGLLTFYEGEVAESRRIVDGASLDDMAADPRAEGATLRWILFHMLEEYARHLGHADLMREGIDGRTGFEG